MAHQRDDLPQTITNLKQYNPYQRSSAIVGNTYFEGKDAVAPDGGQDYRGSSTDRQAYGAKNAVSAGSLRFHHVPRR